MTCVTVVAGARGIAPKYWNNFYNEIIDMQFTFAHMSGQNCSSPTLSTTTKESGYHVSARLMNAMHYGVPQSKAADELHP